MRSTLHGNGFRITVFASLVPLLVACAPVGAGSEILWTTSEPDPPPPDYVVQVVLANRHHFDVVPTFVNGQPLGFNWDPSDNDEEALRLPPGQVRFEFVNAGTMSHNLRVNGESPDNKHVNMMMPPWPEVLAPAESGTLDIHLEPGEYTLSCGLVNHDLRGMERPIIVTDEASYPPLEPAS